MCVKEKEIKKKTEIVEKTWRSEKKGGGGGGGEGGGEGLRSVKGRGDAIYKARTGSATWLQY